MRFKTGEVIECHYFKLTLYSTGRLTLECNTSFTTEFAAIGSREIDLNFEGTINASFIGTTSDGGTVSVDDMTVAVFDFLDHGMITDDNISESKFVVNFESLDDNSIKFLSEIWQRKGRDLKSFPTKAKRKLEGYITFLIGTTEATVKYKTANLDDTVTVSWGLTNLDFTGCEQGSVERPYPHSFRINIDRHTFLISHANDDHYQKIRHLSGTAGVEVTAIVTTGVKVSELSQVESTLENICYLLSLASMNWVTRLYRDVFKGGKKISTTLLPYFTLPFVAGLNLIDLKDVKNCQLRRFVETTYSNYMEWERDFRLRFVIEYYISAARQHSIENKFLIGYIGLECLASNAPRYAKKLGEKLENKDSVIAREEDIKDILRDYDQKLPEHVIQEIARKVAYKGIGDKLTIPYLASKFGIKIDENILDALVDFRNSFMHTGMDHEMVAKIHYDNLLNILERILLSILGWKGNEYIDNLSGSTSVQFPDEVRAFIMEADLPADTLQKLEELIVHLDKYIKALGLTPNIQPSLFIDPDEPQWREILLNIMVNKDLSYIQNNLQMQILDFAQKYIPSNLLDKIIIKINSR